MEFPNDEDKRKRTIRLFTGYFLIAVAIGLASFILVYMTQGYNYDPNKGLNRSSLIFVESDPSSADIYVDNILKDKTNARIVMDEGQHNLSIKKDKYRDWNKLFSIDGGAVLYFSYPKLFPVDIAVGVTQVFEKTPVWVSQSPDRHWLVMQQSADSPILVIQDLAKPTDTAQLYTIPSAQMLNSRGQTSVLTPIEWADDNRHLLLNQKLSDGSNAYILIDRENSDQTINISSKLDINETSSLKLRDKKYDKYYVLDNANGSLFRADLRNGLADNPVLASVVSYKSYADDLVLYATYNGASETEARIEVLKGNDKYLLQNIARDPNAKYLLDMAQYEKQWYYVVSSPSNKKVQVYKNPLNRSKPSNTNPIAPQMSFNLDSPQYVSFSNNTRFIAMQSGKNFVIYDCEQLKPYRFTSSLNIVPTQQAKWMDGHRLSIVTDSKVQVFEFDGTNLQTLTNSRPEFNAYYDRDYKYVFTLMQQADGKTGLENGKLIIN